MCVILIAPKVRPTDAMIEACHASNDKGAGIAWREGGRVRWKKGLLTVTEMQELAATKPLPYVLHFRIPTVGGPRKDLAHPFPIDKSIPNTLEGTTKGFVLFHNGHWNKWRETMLEAVVNTSTKLPAGKYSDSRAMAFCAAIYGIPFLDIIDEKFVAFGPGDEDIEVSTFGWTLVEGVWASNTGWQHRPAWHRRHDKDKEGEALDLRGHNYPHNVIPGGYHTTPPHSLASGGLEGKIDREVLPNEEGEDQLPLVGGRRGSADDASGGRQGHEGSRLRGAGGVPTHFPFGEVHPDVAQLMLDREEISRKQWKKNRNAWFAKERKAKRQGKRGGLTVH